MPPPLTRKLRNASTSGKRHSIGLNKALEKVQKSFLCEVKIEVTRGHQGQNFPKFPNHMTWLHIMRIISVPVTATSKFKKAIESSGNALSLECGQISPKTNGLGVRSHERSKNGIFERNRFSVITSVFEMIEQ